MIYFSADMYRKMYIKLELQETVQETLADLPGVFFEHIGPFDHAEPIGPDQDSILYEVAESLVAIYLMGAWLRYGPPTLNVEPDVELPNSDDYEENLLNWEGPYN
jgi:hypothetical protein